MTKLNAMEMRNVEGGATYSNKCDVCGKKFSAKYYELITWMIARLTVDKKVGACKTKHRMTL
ncbi:MAG: hypothetical protein IKA67_01620 [Clostridia bacterium]|nr:hypothetical protein [Clostridia bacterium]